MKIEKLHFWSIVVPFRAKTPQNKIYMTEVAALLGFMFYVILTLHKVRKFLLVIQLKKRMKDILHDLYFV